MEHEDTPDWCGDPECCSPPELPLLERSVEDLAALVEQLDAEKAAAYVVNGAQAQALRDAVRTLDNQRLGIKIGEALGAGRVRVLEPPHVEIRRDSDNIIGFGGDVLRKVNSLERIRLDLSLDVDSPETLNRLVSVLVECSR